MSSAIVCIFCWKKKRKTFLCSHADSSTCNRNICHLSMFVAKKYGVWQQNYFFHVAMWLFFRLGSSSFTEWNEVKADISELIRMIHDDNAVCCLKSDNDIPHGCYDSKNFIIMCSVWYLSVCLFAESVFVFGCNVAILILLHWHLRNICALLMKLKQTSNKK